MTTEAASREPETETGKRLLADDGFAVMDGVAAVLAIEDELRAKLAAEVEGLQRRRQDSPGMDGSPALGWVVSRDDVLRLLRGDSGGAA